MKLLKRIIIAVIFIPIILYIAYSKNITYSLLFASVVTLGSIFEVYKIYNIKSIFYYGLSFIIVLSNFYLIITKGWINSLIFVFFIIFLLIYEIIKYNKKADNQLKKLLITFFINVYVVLFFSYFLLLKNNIIRSSRWAVLFLISVWIIDTTAYSIGMTIGKQEHRNILKVSPNKSIEGFIAALIIPPIIFIFFRNYFDLTILKSFLFMFLFSIIVQFGDLSQSLIKRYANVKDSGSIIMGHGGIYDRFDSMIFSIPFFYYLIKLIA